MVEKPIPQIPVSHHLSFKMLWTDPNKIPDTSNYFKDSHSSVFEDKKIQQIYNFICFAH
jgi:hypothetical protein